MPHLGGAPWRLWVGVVQNAAAGPFPVALEQRPPSGSHVAAYQQVITLCVYKLPSMAIIVN